MKTAVIYARYSSDSQSEQSIEGQIRVCKQFAEKNDIVIVDTYIDRAMTGTNDNRVAFQKMLKDSANSNSALCWFTNLTGLQETNMKVLLIKKHYLRMGLNLFRQ